MIEKPPIGPSGPFGPSSVPFGGMLVEVPADVGAVTIDGHDVDVVVDHRCHVAGVPVAPSPLPAELRLLPPAVAAVVPADANPAFGPGVAVDQVVEVDQFHTPRLDAVQVGDLDIERTSVVGSAQGLPYL